RGCFFTHGFVAIASHSHGNHAFVVPHSFNATAPEPLKLFLVSMIVPFATVYATPFVVSAHHWFVVAGRNYNAVLICETCVFGIIVGESSGAPHRRPKVIAFVSKNKLKYFLIKFVIEPTEFFLRPITQSRSFIIYEYPPILNTRG